MNCLSNYNILKFTKFNILINFYRNLVNESVKVVDVLAPRDEVLGAPMGRYDGDVYKSYLNLVYSSRDEVRKVPWWKEIHY